MTWLLFVAFAIGLVCGGFSGALFAFWWLLPRVDQLKTWRYECTCGWHCLYLASVGCSPSFLRCEDCHGIAIRRREPERAENAA